MSDEKIEALSEMEWAAKLLKDNGYPDSAKCLLIARASVAELLEVVKHLRAILPSESWADDARKMADAAIANASGRSS